MANREILAQGLGVRFGTSGGFTTASAATYGSLTWLPCFVTTQGAWTTGTAYAAGSDQAVGAQVSSGSNTYVVLVKGAGNSTVNPTSGTTTQYATTGVLADGYNWLCLGNATADFTTLANGYQAVSQIVLDNRPSAGFGDTMMELGISLATGSSGAAGDYITAGMQALNQDGSTYGDGLGGGSSLSAPQLSQGAIQYPAGKSTPIVGRTLLPILWNVLRPFLQNSSGNALSASTHVVAFRTGVLNSNG